VRGRMMILLAAAVAMSGAAGAKEHEKHHDNHNNGHSNREWNERHYNNGRHADRRHHNRNYVVYSAPYHGWSYRRVNVGYHLRPAFYGHRYVINDYGVYRLRAPGSNRAWVRYGDDLLLVNLRTGRVLEVIPGGYY
jgi:Ni/Co efflux regulator RcnB